MSTPRSALLLLLLLIATLPVAGCGKKGPLQPRQQLRPGPVENARLIQRGTTFQLRWRLPQTTGAGTPTEIDSVRVERLVSPPDAYCPECSDPWPIIARINPRLPDPARQIRDMFLLNNAVGQAGSTVYYRLSAHNLDGYTGPSLILQQSFREPPASLTGLEAVSADRSAELRWQPATPPSGATLLGYQVYRRLSGEDYSPLPTNIKPLSEPRFSDFGLENGRRYEYRVRSLFDFSGEQVESLPGEEISITPQAG